MILVLIGGLLGWHGLKVHEQREIVVAIHRTGGNEEATLRRRLRADPEFSVFLDPVRSLER